MPVFIGKKQLHSLNMESDDEHDDDALNKQLTGFLFGNIDENGKLESDFLDEDAKKHVSSLSK